MRVSEQPGLGCSFPQQDREAWRSRLHLRTLDENQLFNKLKKTLNAGMKHINTRTLNSLKTCRVKGTTCYL